MKKFFKRLFCKHIYIVVYNGIKFEQSPYHRSGIGYMFKVKISKCNKCYKNKEDKIYGVPM